MERFARIVSLCWTGLLPLAAGAGSFSVNPIRLEMAPTQNATSVIVANAGKEAQLLQVRVYRWSHRNGEESLTEVEGVDAPIVTPPLFRLAANGGSQVVRVGFLKPAGPIAEERQWRVILEEVPKPTEPDQEPEARAPGEGFAIAMRLRISLPLFQRPAAMHQDLQWTAQPTASGGIRLGAENRGNSTERLDELSIGSPGDPGAHLTGPFYLFPGERREFDLTPKTALTSDQVKLSLQGTPRPLTHDLVLRAQ